MDLVRNVKLVQLFEVYGNSLTEKQHQIFNLYVLNDLSLAEVSSILDISRQAVKYALDNATLVMNKLEDELKILSKLSNIKSQLVALKKDIVDEKTLMKINKILEEI